MIIQLSRLYRGMKTLKNTSLIGAIIFSSILSVQAWAQDMSGVMMVVKGDVKVTGKDGKTDSAKVGRKVISGDTITAGADSRAKIVMADKNVINVSPDSKVLIEKYENNGKDKKNVELNVMYGKVRASVEQKYDGEKSKFNIKTPSAVAGVRGTDFMAGYSPQTKVTQVITFTGTVAVGTPGPGGNIQNPVFVQPGQMTQVGSGQAPEPPKAVPKEELNNANKETKAETATGSSGQKDSQGNGGDSSASNKDDNKKEDAKDSKKEDVKKDEVKKDETKKDDSKKEASGEKSSSDNKSPNDKKNSASDKSASDSKSPNDKRDEPKKDSRAPASTPDGGGTSPSTTSSGPGGNGTPQTAPAPSSTAPPPLMAPPLPGAPGGEIVMPVLGPAPTILPTVNPVITPIQNTFIDNTVKLTQKTRLSITIKGP